MTIPEILKELNLENGSNYKIETLKKYKDNELLKLVLKMAVDKVAYTYGISMLNIPEIQSHSDSITLPEALDMVENLNDRTYTGNAANSYLVTILSSLSEDNADVIVKIINRDLRINLGRTQINKVFTGLITKVSYMRCGIFSEKTSKDIKFPAIIQKKADGVFSQFEVIEGEVYCVSRSAESYEYPIIFKQMSKFPDGFYMGELTVRGLIDRAEGNGLLNSDNPPHEDIELELWDYVTHSDYRRATLKDKKYKPEVIYADRFNNLQAILKGNSLDNVKAIEHIIVDTLKEATDKTSEWMLQGYEGSILKDKSGLFKDGTSKEQLKLKVSFNVDVRITGFIEGTKGTKRENTFGSIIYTTDDGLIQGSVSGFTDAQLNDFNSRRDELIGLVIEVEANDLTKGRDNDYYALSHPRFIELRIDKDETDDLKRAKASLELAKLFKQKEK